MMARCGSIRELYGQPIVTMRQIGGWELWREFAEIHIKTILSSSWWRIWCWLWGLCLHTKRRTWWPYGLLRWLETPRRNQYWSLCPRHAQTPSVSNQMGNTKLEFQHGLWTSKWWNQWYNTNPNDLHAGHWSVYIYNDTLMLWIT